ncbi:hypothetical protein R6242_21010 [Iodobacter sp. CM08]|uniref:hypothetical protein n=1 Tax=Iodobacter sp. CM08 TaxID=3085902 RepID=UPI0029820B47|nr:hypothetical protein [Iodobacter sp. CM08]MDW5419055.1 hypothetical protein [Iodobacter sp. CM08]
MTQLYAYIRDGVVAHVTSTVGEELAGLQCVVPLIFGHEVALGDRYDGNDFYPVAVVAPTKVLLLSPPEFKLLFLPAERVAIKALRATDEYIADFFSIIDDPRLTQVDLSLQSTRLALTYLEEKKLITPARHAEILGGRIS